MDASGARIILNASIYKTFPLEWVRSFTDNRSVVSIGAINRAVSESLPGAQGVNAFEWLDATADERRPALGKFLRQMARTDCLVITEPECADCILGEAELLFELRQKVKFRVILPLVIEPNETAISETRGLAAPECSDDLHWNWVSSADGVAKMALWHTGAARAATFSFRPWFGPAAVQQQIASATLRIGDALGQRSFNLAPDVAVDIDLDIDHGLTMIEIASDLPPDPTPSDSRALSLGICQPKLRTPDGVLLEPATFFASGRKPPLTRARNALHRAGFIGVHGRIAHPSDNPIWRDVPRSAGSPTRSLFEPGGPMPIENEPDVGGNDVIWLVAE